MSALAGGGDLRVLLADEADDPPLNGPRQLPDLRLTLLERWQPGGRFYEMAAMTGVMHPHYPAPADAVFNLQGLPRVALWWATEDMTELVAHAARSLVASNVRLIDSAGVRARSVAAAAGVDCPVREGTGGQAVAGEGRRQDGPHVSLVGQSVVIFVSGLAGGFLGVRLAFRWRRRP
jgi:hypothetical protein